MTEKRPIPFDFAEQSATMGNQKLMRHYNAGQHTIQRWRKEIGSEVASTGGIERLAVPDDWYEVAPEKSQRFLRQHYKRHSKVIQRWCRETGMLGNGKPGPKAGHGIPTRPVPEDFPAKWATMSQLQLTLFYGCHRRTVARWVEECGLERPARVRKPRPTRTRGPARLIARQPGTTVSAGRNMTIAGQAADFLRRFGPVARCQPDGRYAENGSHWRRGATVLSADDIASRAKRLGFNPDAWREIA